jgi:phosphatidylinositol alpha 1,6-mannosyltransferase
MRIAVVTESFAPRSDETADGARHLVDEFLALGHELLIATTGPGVASYRGATVVRTRRLIPAAALTQRLSRFRPHAILAISPRVLGAVALGSGQRLGIPTLTLNASAPIATTLRIDRHLVSHRGAVSNLAAVNIGAHLWLPGVDLDGHHPGLRDESLRETWAKGNRLVVGFAGKANKEKVVARLQKIAAMDEARLVIIGTDAPVIPGAKTTPARTGLDRARAIASCDVLVQARKKDELVPGVRQALACGVPVVGFDAGGTREIVRHEVNGLVVRFDRNPDEPGLRGSLRRLLNEDGLRGRLAAQARDSVADRSWTQAAAELNDHLLQIASPALAV